RACRRDGRPHPEPMGRRAAHPAAPRGRGDLHGPGGPGKPGGRTRDIARLPLEGQGFILHLRHFFMEPNLLGAVKHKIRLNTTSYMRVLFGFFLIWASASAATAQHYEL